MKSAIFSLKKKKEIDLIFYQKKSIGNSFFVIYKKKHHFNHFKFGLSIGKKFGIAVLRNQMKRRIRAILTKNFSLLNPFFSFVIVIKPKANILSFLEIEKYILLLFKKHNLLLEKKNEKY